MSDQPAAASPGESFGSGLVPCYRHSGVMTGVHCTRCGRPICPDCMIPAPVGYQCPDCVEQARKEFRRIGAGPQQVRSMGGTPATFVLLALIALGFVVQTASAGRFDVFGAGGEVLVRGANIPVLIAQGEYYRLITAIFLHGGILHLLLNAYGLYLFGGFIERSLGRGQMVALFFVTGFVASATSYLLAPSEFWAVPAIGASGAVFGLFGAFIAYNFRRRGTRWNRSLLQQGLFWLMINVFFSLRPGIDWRAHLGGVVAGFAGGFLLEAGGERLPRRAAQFATLTGLFVVGVAMVAWKTADIRDALAAFGL